jgi:hypothetical protein
MGLGFRDEPWLPDHEFSFLRTVSFRSYSMLSKDESRRSFLRITRHNRPVSYADNFPAENISVAMTPSTKNITDNAGHIPQNDLLQKVAWVKYNCTDFITAPDGLMPHVGLLAGDCVALRTFQGGTIL